MRGIIIGNSGSGKSWLAQSIGTPCGVKVIHLDDVFWGPGGFNNARSKDEVATIIDALKQNEAWIVEGVFRELAHQFTERADWLIWLDLPWHVCRARLLTRCLASKMHHGRKQTEDDLAQLLDWATDYYHRDDTRSYKGDLQMFATFSNTKHRVQSEQHAMLKLREITS